MKRISYFLCFLMIAMLFVSCTGTNDSQNNESNVISVYYINREETEISPVEYHLQSEDVQNGLLELLAAMQLDPENHELKASIFNDIQVLTCHVEEDKAIIDLSKEYGNMDFTTEILIRAAIVRTVTQLEGVSLVLMTIEGEPLLDHSRTVVNLMSADMFLDNAGSEISNYETVKLQLYFANSDGTALVPVTQTIEYNTNVSLEKLVVEQLIKGPATTDAYPTINPATKIVNVTLKDGTCYVNLDSSFLSQVYNVNSEVTIYSIANSLIALNNVNKVQILVDGETDITYRESMELDNPFGRNLDLVEEGQ